MMGNLKGFSQVFSFTFCQQTKRKGYWLTTLLIALSCLLLPAGIMAAVESHRAEPSTQGVCAAETIRVVDRTPGTPADLSLLNAMGVPGLNGFSYVADSSVDSALAAADSATLVVVMEQNDEGYRVQVLLPENSGLGQQDADSYAQLLDAGFPAILQMKAGITQSVQVSAQVQSVEAETDGSGNPAREVMGMVIPYLNIMVLYFLILLYGQGVANSVILEKTSKLMDFFLVTVKPAAMVLGKVLAIALAGFLQLVCVLLGLAGGFAAGTCIARAIHPDTTMGLIRIFDSFDLLSGMFSLPAVVIAIAIVLAGFLLYCALASIGGSLAGKPEDLSSTNMLFVMALVISFFCCLYAGGMNGMSSSARWLDYFPLTAILVTPARVLIGETPLWTGLVSLALVLVCALLLTVLAGKVYEMMSLYKGNAPSVQRMFRMLRERKK